MCSQLFSKKLVIHKRVLINMINSKKNDFSFFISSLGDNYLELVGFGNDSRGRISFLALLFLISFSYMLYGSLRVVVSDVPLSINIIFSIGGVVCLLLCIISAFLLKFDAFKSTSYPVIIDRKKNMIHIYQHKNGFISLDWNDVKLEVSALEGVNRVAGGRLVTLMVTLTNEPTASTVKSFPIASNSLGNQVLMNSLGDFINEYMRGRIEANTGKSFVRFCMPGVGSRESISFVIFNAFSFCESPIVKFILSPIISTMALGRFFAIYTSKVVEWPKNVDDRSENIVCINNENYGELPRVEKTWVIFCFLFGVVFDIFVIQYFFFS